MPYLCPCVCLLLLLSPKTAQSDPCFIECEEIIIHTTVKSENLFNLPTGTSIFHQVKDKWLTDSSMTTGAL